MSKIKKIGEFLFPNLYYYLQGKSREKQFQGIRNYKEHIELKYKSKFGVELNLENPVTFYDKLNYLRLYSSDDDVSYLVDKIKVKEYLVKLGYEEYIAKLIDSFSNFNDFSKFYKEHKNKISYVVKLNHTSGDVFFYNNGKWRDKKGKPISRRIVFGILKQRLNLNYFHYSLEKQYDSIQPRILVEEYLESLNDHGLDEYKFFCNYGEAKLINVVKGRQDASNLREAFTDSNLRILNAYQKEKILDQKDIIKPKNFDEMIRFCETTTNSLPLIRVDLMTNGNKFYFCEFTFFDCGGMNIFYPEKANKELGELFDISRIIQKNH